MVVKHEIKRNDGVVVASQKANLDEPSAGRQAANVAREIGSADEVDDQIDPMGRRSIDDLRLEVRTPIIKDGFGTQREHILDVPCRSGRQHMCSGRFSELNRSRSDASGGGMDKGGFSFSNLSEMGEGFPSR